MSKLVILGLVAVTAAACSTASEMRTASGERELLVRCSPAFMSLCLTKAEEECGGPYETLSISGGDPLNNMHVRCQG